MAKSKKPTAPPPRDQKEQSERFLAAVQALVDAGELNPTEAEVLLDTFVRKKAVRPANP